MGFLQTSLAEVMGKAVDDPGVQKAIASLEAALERFKRDQRIYELRCTSNNMPVSLIAQQAGVGRQHCHTIIKRQIMIRRLG